MNVPTSVVVWLLISQCLTLVLCIVLAFGRTNIIDLHRAIWLDGVRVGRDCERNAETPSRETD